MRQLAKKRSKQKSRKRMQGPSSPSWLPPSLCRPPFPRGSKLHKPSAESSWPDSWVSTLNAGGGKGGASGSRFGGARSCIRGAFGGCHTEGVIACFAVGFHNVVHVCCVAPWVRQQAPPWHGHARHPARRRTHAGAPRRGTQTREWNAIWPRLELSCFAGSQAMRACVDARAARHREARVNSEHRVNRRENRLQNTR